MKQEKDIIFRDKEFEEISDLLNTSEGIRVHSDKGLGTSKILRYIHTNSKIKKRYFSKFVTHYIDLALDTSMTNLLDLDDKNKNLVIINNANKLSTLSEEEILYLKSLKYDKNCTFILDYKNTTDSSEKLRSLFNICPHKYEILPLDKERMILTIKDMLKVWNKSLEEKEIENIAKQIGGNPSLAKELLSKKLFNKIDLSNEIFEDKLTKNEFLIFQLLKNNKNKLTKRDDLAFALSPDSNGDGVSNEAIDQIIKRIRKKLKDTKSELSINTKRGFGYILKYN